MAFSSGGVVRVDDLIHALVISDIQAAHPELTSPAVVVTQALPISAPPTASTDVAMTNDPALRAVLNEAYELALIQEGSKHGQVSPACLAASCVTCRSLEIRNAVTAIESLGLVVPPHLSSSIVSKQSKVPEVPAKRMENEVINEALELWLKMQTTETESERQKLEGVITELIRTMK